MNFPPTMTTSAVHAYRTRLHVDAVDSSPNSDCVTSRYFDVNTLLQPNLPLTWLAQLSHYCGLCTGI